MLKQYSKNLSYGYKKSKNLINPLPYRDFLIFRKKFCGYFIFRGKKSLSFKNFNYFILNLKKLNKKKKQNPMKLFFKIIKEVTPFLTIGFRKIGTNSIQVPSLLYGNKKNVFLLKWIVKQVKGKSNIYGIRKQDVLKNLIDIYKLRGNVLKLKEQHNNKIILTRINLKNEGIQFSKKESRKLERQNYLDSKDEFWKQEIRRLNEEFNPTDEEIENEFEDWKEVEPDYKFLKNFKRVFRQSRNKNKRYVDIYKKFFVK